MRVKDIKGFEGIYAVTDEGHVISLYRTWRDVTGRMRCMGSRVMACNPCKRGYVKVHLSAPDRPHRETDIHRLVAEAFCFPYSGEEVNHIDGNPSNNKASNLEWSTSDANRLHATLRKQHVYLTAVQIMEVQRLFDTMPTSVLAERFNVHKDTIDRIARGPRKRRVSNR